MDCSSAPSTYHIGNTPTIRPTSGRPLPQRTSGSGGRRSGKSGFGPIFIHPRSPNLLRKWRSTQVIPTSCGLFDIGPNLTSFLIQLLVVLGALAAAYRGQSIVRMHA